MSKIPYPKTLQQAQSIVDKCLADLRDDLPENELIFLLASYVSGSDFIGVKHNHAKVLAALKAMNYQSIANLPNEVRKGSGKENLAKCIVGNCVASFQENMIPPPNVMMRFSEEYLG